MGSVRFVKQTWFLLILCCLTYVCFGMTRSLSKQLQNEMNSVTLVNKNEAWTQEEVKLMRETELQQENPAVFCAWSEHDNQTVKNQELDRSLAITALFVDGDAAFISEDYRGLSQEDTMGCLIDKTSAYSLFGSAEAVGQKLNVQDQTLIVRGVMHKAEHLIILNAPDAEEKAGEMISLRLPETVDAIAYTDHFCNRHGVLAYRLELSVFSVASQFFSCLFPLLLTFFSVIPFLKCAHRERRFPIRAFSIAVLGFVFLLTFLKLVRFEWQISASMLPTKLSDFEFWSDLLKQQQQAFQFLMRSKKLQSQVNVIYQFLIVFVCSMTAIAGAVYLRRRLWIRTWRQVFGGSILTFCCAFLICLLFQNETANLSKDMGLWLIGSVYLVAGKLRTKILRDDAYDLTYHSLELL